MITTRNGLAAMMVTFWRLDRASLPPETSRVNPMAAVSTPQAAVTHLLATSTPCWLMDPITGDAESAEVIKNVASRIMATMAAMVPPGREYSRSKSWRFASPSPHTERFSCSKWMAVPPKILNHTTVTAAGMIITPTTNSRMERPREMRATNMPTKGLQEIHHAQ